MIKSCQAFKSFSAVPDLNALEKWIVMLSHELAERILFEKTERKCVCVFVCESESEKERARERSGLQIAALATYAIQSLCCVSVGLHV